jgi:hypothetical protein
MSSLGPNLIRALLLVALLAAAAVAAPIASSDETAAGPTLQGENLLAPFSGVTVTSTCEENGTSTVTYQASGVATGPFPGTFTAQGTITIGPQTTPVIPPAGTEPLFTGPILTLSEMFTILSAGTTITGTKTLTQPLESLGESERATCQDVTLFGGVTGTGRVVEVRAATTYQATIDPPLGQSTTDSGRATPVLSVVDIEGIGSIHTANFDQLFTLSDQAPTECDDDEDGDNQGGDGDDQGCDEDPGDQ